MAHLVLRGFKGAKHMSDKCTVEFSNVDVKFSISNNNFKAWNMKIRYSF